jgi:uncharacterized membrane protein YfcA
MAMPVVPRRTGQVSLMPSPLLVALAVLAASVGTVGGIGGAVLLVPILVVSGMDPAEAAPLGLVTVAAASLSAAPSQLVRGVVHHRIGVTLELTASATAVAAAIVSDSVDDTLLRLVLAASAFLAGVVGLASGGVRNVPQPEFVAEPAAEWPGTLGGAYAGPGGTIPYRARHLPVGIAAMTVAGAVTGLSGVSGGFIKTPIMREVMGIPVKVAAATTTFTVGITAAASLLVFAGQDRIEVHGAALVAFGGLVGGVLGARVQDRLSPTLIRRFLGVVLIAISLVLAVTG